MISMIQRMMVRIGVVVETNQAKEEARMIEDALDLMVMTVEGNEIREG